MAKQSRDWKDILVKRGVVGPDQIKEAERMGNVPVEDALSKLDGGMRPKLAACVEAINAGVSAAHIIDGRGVHSLLLELFTDAGIGTKIEAAA